MASPITITTDELKTLHAWLERAMKAGLKISDLQPSIDDPKKLRQIVQYIKAGALQVLLPDPSYDAATILNFGQPMQGNLPQAEPGEVIIWYGGWSLQQLRDNAVVRQSNLMCDQDWYNDYDWSKEVLPVGFYRLRMPVPNTNNKMFNAQLVFLVEGEQAAHPVLVATADLCHEIQTGRSLLEGIYVRTSKLDRAGNSVGLKRNEGRLLVSLWSDKRCDLTFLASAQSCN